MMIIITTIIIIIMIMIIIIFIIINIDIIIFIIQFQLSILIGGGSVQGKFFTIIKKVELFQIGWDGGEESRA